MVMTQQLPPPKIVVTDLRSVNIRFWGGGMTPCRKRESQHALVQPSADPKYLKGNTALELIPSTDYSYRSLHK